MKKLLPCLVVTLVLSLMPLQVSAQRGGRGGERGVGGGGERGSRGGGERGGPGGGDRGGPGGGERGGQRGGPGGAERGGPAGGRGGDRGGAARPTMDANGDGRIDAAELKNMPEGLRAVMESRGIKVEAGVSMDELREKIRSGVYQRGPSENPYGRPDESSSGNRSRYTPPQPFRPRDREPLTKSLPEEYAEMDIDYDGQIALYEWMKTRRQELDGFDARDSNRDGMLTPKELHAFAELNEQDEPQVVSYTRERLTVVGSGGSSSGSSSSNSKSKKGEKSLSKEEKVKHEQRGEFFVKYIDKNRDGKIDMQEWESNSKARSFMEGGGQKIQPMSNSEFIKRYVKIQADKAGR